MNKLILSVLAVFVAVCYGNIIAPTVFQEKVPEESQIAAPNTSYEKCMEDLKQFKIDVRDLQQAAERRLVFESEDILRKTRVTFSEVKKACVNEIMERI